MATCTALAGGEQIGQPCEPGDTFRAEDIGDGAHEAERERLHGLGLKRQDVEGQSHSRGPGQHFELARSQRPLHLGARQEQELLLFQVVAFGCPTRASCARKKRPVWTPRFASTAYAPSDSQSAAS